MQDRAVVRDNSTREELYARGRAFLRAPMANIESTAEATTKSKRGETFRGENWMRVSMTSPGL